MFLVYIAVSIVRGCQQLQTPHFCLFVCKAANCIDCVCFCHKTVLRSREGTWAAVGSIGTGLAGTGRYTSAVGQVIPSAAGGIAGGARGYS